MLKTTLTKQRKLLFNNKINGEGKEQTLFLGMTMKIPVGKKNKI